jgi:hypothetical protein
MGARAGRTRLRRWLGCAAALVLLAAVMASSASAGSRLFFSSSRLFDGKLWSVRPDGSGRRLLRNHVLTGPIGVTATISRDGRHILCLCRKVEIDSMRLDGSHMHPIGRRPAGTKYDIVGLGAGGEAIWLRERHDQLTMQRADGSHRIAIDHGSPGGRFIEEEFAVDRAGDKVAYETLRCGRNCQETEAELWVKRIGGRKTRVYRTAGKRAVTALTWSADGKELAFADAPNYEELEKYEEPEDPNSYMFVYRDGRSHEIKVTAPAGPYPMAFSPDGSRLAVAGEETSGGESSGSIYSVGLDGATPRRAFSTKCGPACFWPPWAFGWVAR